MLNYEIDPSVLQPFVPTGTKLDQWSGKTFVSVVGFMFLNTRVLGLPIPFHTNFEEVNLRFYVRRITLDGPRRGVVFIKEIVPRAAIAWTARTFYNENYVSLPMRHKISGDAEGESIFCYEWNFNRCPNWLSATICGQASEIEEGSAEEYITEHYWGYARQRDGGTVEYQVEHPRWRVWSAKSYDLRCDFERLYGRAFAPFLLQPPASAFVADGSAVTVRKGRRLILE